MVLLDTNVVSAVMKPEPPGSVTRWLDRQPTIDLYVSTVTIAEIRYGLRILPSGRRRADRARRFAEFIEKGFAHRTLPFDTESAEIYGDLMGRRRELGHPMSILDGQIAAIARRHGMAIATRNADDFRECGLEILNPFDP